MSLAVPLTQSQVSAANHLHSRLSQWGHTDQALGELARRFPGFDVSSALLKVAAVNQLYGTNVYAVARMAEHIAKVLAEEEASIGHGDAIPADAALVERLAAMPKSARQKGERRHFSFASKFAHFFIDSERFPIYDSFASKMVKHHLKPDDFIADAARPYQAFVLNIVRLREDSGITCTARELDGYLWLAGLYAEWLTHKDKARIHAEVARLFESLPSTDIDLANLTEQPTSN